jgi:hypothetical protein
MAKKKKKPPNKTERLRAEVKRTCRLNNDDIRMAKEMGLNARSLIKNIPSKTEPWKLPVKVWIHEMYGRQHQKQVKKKPPKNQA